MKKNEDFEMIPLVQIPESANYALPDDNLLSFYNDLEERLFWVTDEINSYSLNLVHYILKWNREDKEIEPSARKPIRLLIFSPGGNLDCFTAIGNVIRLSKTPVIGINISCAYSAAAMILLMCHKRYALSNDSTVLFHQGGCSGVQGTYDQVANFMKDYEKQVARLSQIILDRTSFTKEEVNEKMKSDWYVSAQEGVERGIYDGIISSIDELI